MLCLLAGKFGTALIDVDFAVSPKVRMSFVNVRPDKNELADRTERKGFVERELEDLDLACGQALN